MLDRDPERAAQYHNDRHVIKMLLESAQLLSTACRVSGLDCGYKLTHINHPCSVWVRESLDNWQWLKVLAKHLNSEFRYRFNHADNHKSYDVIAGLPEPALTPLGLTQFAQAMPDECRQEDPVTAYRLYYIQHKNHIAKWTKRSVPNWWNNVKDPATGRDGIYKRDQSL